MNTDSSLLEAKRLVNKVAAMYDGCEAENAALQQQVNTCINYQDACDTALQSARSLLHARQQQLSQKDSIISLYNLQAANCRQQVRDEKKIATHRLIGFSLGGFFFGVSLPLVVYFLKR